MVAKANVSFEFDPFKTTRIKVPKENQEEALEEVKEFVIEQVLLSIGEGESPVKGGRWKRDLSKEYRKIKANESSVGFANLELSGDLLDALDVVKKKSTKLALEVIDRKQWGKAEGNNIGSYGRKRGDSSNARNFIPRGRQTFTPEIWAGIKGILRDFKE